MPKRGESKGSIYFDKNKNRWVAQYYEFDYEKNKRVRRTKFLKTEEEARKKLESIMYQKNNSLFIEHNGIPLIELMKSIAKRKLDSNLISTGQFARINKTINTISKSNIANKKIDDITSEEIQNYLNSVKHYSDSTIKKIAEQFGQAYTDGMNKGYIYRNPMNEVIRPKSTKRTKIIRALTIEEQKDFNKYLKSTHLEVQRYRNEYMFQMYLGLRVGEALALTIDDIDLKNKKVSITKTLSTDENGKIIMRDTTKTYAGTREVPIPKFINKYLKEQMKLAQNNRDKLLFITDNGNYVDERNVNRELKKIMKEQFDITDITTHSLRHTFGTRCIEAGMNPVVLQKLMGHNDVSVTLNTYTTVFYKYKEEELEKVNNYYKQNKLFVVDENER